MALIGTIRKNFWFVLIVLGIALASFVIMDMVGANGPQGGLNPVMGSVAGEKINYQEFTNAQNALYSNSGADQNAIRNILWDFFVEKAIVNKESDALGMRISGEELMDLQFGQNISPVVQQNFRDPQTGQINTANLQQFKDAIENGTFTNQQLRAFWAEQEKQVIKTQKQTKLSNMVSKGLYTPTWMLEENHNGLNGKVDFNYVKIPFDNIPEADIEVTDSDIQNYINTNKARYRKSEETRVAKYLVHDVVATSADSSIFRNELLNLIDTFSRSNNDSLFAVSQGGSLPNVYFAQADLPESVRDIVPGMEEGQVTQPYLDNGTFSVLKLVDKRVVADSVEARHVLRRADPANPAQIASARAYCDSLLNVVRSGSQSFADMAKANSEDTGSGAKGGDLGTFAQGAMVPSFNDFCFTGGDKGDYGIVNSRFGVHLIHIQDKVYNNRDSKYKVAYIAKAIVPSEETQNAVNDNVVELVEANRTIAELEAAISGNPELRLESSPSLKANDFSIGTLGSGNTARDMVKWLFDSDNGVGDVSPEVYGMRNQALYYDDKYVALALESIEPKGLQSINSVRTEVEGILLNKARGEKIIAKINGTDLGTIANDFGTELESAIGANFSTANPEGLGFEPEVVAAASNLDLNAVSKPIIGKTGVFVVQPTNKTEAGALSNVPFLRSSATNSVRGQVNFKLMEALKSNVEVSDKRVSLDL